MTAVAAIFTGLITVHLASSIWINRRADASRASGAIFLMTVWPFYVVVLCGIKNRARALRANGVIQTLLFAGACWLAISTGAWSRQLLSPVAIGAGLLAGHLVFGASVLATHKSATYAAAHVGRLTPIWDFIADNPRVLMQFASVGIVEETIYRAALQPLAISWLGPAGGVIAVALVFSAVHEHFFRNSLRQSGEFLAFALLLGFLYYWTASLILVIVVHAIRNIEISFMEHVARVEEDGEEAADRELLFNEGALMQALVIAPACGMETACLEFETSPPGLKEAKPLQAWNTAPLELR